MSEFFSLFSLGWLSILGILVVPVVYLLGRAFRWFGAHIERTEYPKDRIIYKLVIACILGFIMGCFAQSMYEKYTSCKANVATSPVVCVMQRLSNK